MRSWSGRRLWLLAAPLLVALLVVGSLVTIQPARAADGYNISNMGQTMQQAVGISPDGGKLCAVWTQFDVETSQVYFRLYTVAAQSWSPALGTAPTQVSTAGNTNRPRCTVDGAGRAHVVWQEKGGGGQLNVAHRAMEPDGSWGGVTVLGQNRSSSDIDHVAPDAAGKVWVVYRRYVEGGSSELELRSWSPSTGWTAPKAIATGGGADDPRVNTDNNGYVHLVFRNGGSSGINYVSLDPAGTFGPQVQVPGGTQTGVADIAVNRATGAVHIVFVKDFTKVYYASKPSYTAGIAVTQVATGAQQVDEPGIAWSTGGRVFIVYNNNRGAEIDYLASDNGGQTWNGPFAFAAPPGGTSSPWLVAGPSNVGYVVYNRRSESSVYFTTVSGNTPPAQPAPSPTPTRPSTPTPTPSPTPSPTPAPPATTPATAAAPIADGRHEYFTQTGHNLGNAFREYWHAQGGLLRFGYPLTEEFVERNLDDGKEYTVQYFERARFEWHPENPSPYNILLGRLGLVLRPLDPPATALPGAAYFPETGHNLGGAFLAYWQQNGGLAVFGYPTSEEFDEVSPTDGKTYRVQYFERNRFEYHPENEGTPYNVLLGLLGRQQLVDRGWLK